MEEWGWNPSTVSAIGSAAVLIAFAGLLAEMTQNRKARNLEAILTISADFRTRWEKGWGAILRDQVPNLSLEERQKGEVGRELAYMCNWLDWMGLLTRKKLIDKELLFGGLSSPIKEILRESAHQLQTDIEEKGGDWWVNLLFIAEQPEINVDIAQEAERCKQRWSARPAPGGEVH